MGVIDCPFPDLMIVESVRWGTNSNRTCEFAYGGMVIGNEAGSSQGSYLLNQQTGDQYQCAVTEKTVSKVFNHS